MRRVLNPAVRVFEWKPGKTSHNRSYSYTKGDQKLEELLRDRDTSACNMHLADLIATGRGRY